MECSKCKKYTEERAFAVFRHRDGRVGRRGVCKQCRAAYQEENYEKLKKYRKEYNEKNRSKKAKDSHARRKKVKAIIDKIKTENCCTDCGGFFPPVAMDFDHIGHKNKSVASMYSQAYKIDLILEEIKLCELVCACCHRVRTEKRKQGHTPYKPRGKNKVTLVEPKGGAR